MKRLNCMDTDFEARFVTLLERAGISRVALSLDVRIHGFQTVQHGD